MVKTPLIEVLINHVNRQPLSFHTPGHKSGKLKTPFLNMKDLWKYDLTEIPGLDNLHYPEGCIREAEEAASSFYGAKDTHFLVNGSSCGLHSAIMALGHDSFVFVPRHVHKSIHNALILAGARPIYLPVEFEKKFGIPLGVNPDTFKKFINKYPDCKVLVLPNPNYQGISYKIEEMINLAKSNKIKVIIDEAHGAHFPLHEALPPSGLELGADLIIQSWHKTLPVFTQGSVIHTGKDYKGPSIRPFINMLQTTSPSYLLLASMDSCRAFLEEQGKEMLDKTYNRVNAFKEDLKRETSFIVDFNLDMPKDFLKLNITSRYLSGFEIEKILIEKYAIYPELSEENYCLFMFALNIEDDVLLKLKKALLEINNLKVDSKERNELEFVNYYDTIPQKGILPKEAFYGEKEEISVDDALGRVCAEYIMKYPPGIPLVLPGEILDFKILQILKQDPGFKAKKNIIVMTD